MVCFSSFLFLFIKLFEVKVTTAQVTLITQTESIAVVKGGERSGVVVEEESVGEREKDEREVK